jgi:hypothetical protein
MNGNQEDLKKCLALDPVNKEGNVLAEDMALNPAEGMSSHAVNLFQPESSAGCFHNFVP